MSKTVAINIFTKQAAKKRVLAERRLKFTLIEQPFVNLHVHVVISYPVRMLCLPLEPFSLSKKYLK